MNNFLDITSPLVSRVGQDGMERIAVSCLRIAQDNWPFFVNLLETSTSLIDRLLHRGDKALVMSVFDLTEHLARSHPSPALVLLDKSPDIIDRVGYEGFNNIADLAGAVAAFSWGIASRLVEKSPYLSDSLLRCVNRSLAAEVYGLAAQVARDRWKPAIQLLENSPDIIGRLSAFGNESLVGDVLGFAGEVAKDSPGIGVRLFEKSPDLIEAIGFEGLQKVAHVALRAAVDSEDSGVRLLEKSPDVLERLLIHGDRNMILGIYDLAYQIALDNVRIAITMCERSPELIESVGYDGLGKIAHTCCRLGGDGEETDGRVVCGLIESSPDLIERAGYQGFEEVATLIVQVGRESCKTALHLCKKSPEIIERVSFEGFKDLASICMSLVRDGSSLTPTLLEKSPALMDRLLRRGDPSLVKKVYDLMHTVARDNPKIALSLLEKSPDLYDHVGLKGLQEIAAVSLRVAHESWTTADCFIKISFDLVDRGGFDGLEQIADLCLLIARENVYGAVSLLEKCPSLMDRLSQYGDRSLVKAVHGIGADVARINWTTAVSLLEKSPEIIERLGLQGLEQIADLGSRLASNDSRIAVSLLAISPELLDRIDFEGLSVVASYCNHVAQSSWETAVGLLRKSIDLIDRLLQLGDRSLVIDVYRLMDNVANSSWRVSASLLEKSGDYVELAGYQGLAFIAHRARELAGISEKNAVSFAEGESIEFADFVENIPKGLELKRVKTVLSNYLMALLGYRVEIAEGKSASTDGRTIYLPKRVREFEDDEANFIYYKVIATHQEAHLEYGSFDFDMKDVEDLVTRVKSKYGIRDVIGASDIERFYQFFPEPELVKDLFNIFEDYRIEARLIKEYPVLGTHVLSVNKHSLIKRSSLNTLTNDKQRSVEAIGRALIASQREEDLTDAVDEVLQYALALSRSLLSFHAGVHDAARAATDTYFLIDDTFAGPYRQIKPISKPIDELRVNQNIGSFGRTSKRIREMLRGEAGQKDDQPKGGHEHLSEPSGETNPSSIQPDQNTIAGSNQPTSKERSTFKSQDSGGKYGPTRLKESTEKDHDASHHSMNSYSVARIERLLRDLFKNKGITPKEIESKTRHMKPGEIEVFLNHLVSSIRIKTELEGEKGTHLYPEWGDDIDGYRENWSRVREQDLKGTSQSFYHETVQKHSGLLKRIRREFQMLKPEDFTRMERQYDGDDIDLDAAIEYFIDRRIGTSPSEKNYMRTEKKKRDIAVVFLIDMSRSTKGATIHCEKEALIIMSEALREVGDAFAIFGFSGDNRDNVDFYTIKDFEESYDHAVKARISAIDYGFENRDGTALRHTISLLKRREEKTKMIILISDGKPVDKEYSGNYAIEDTRMALKEAKKYGINTFCITVDKSAAEYLPRMYSHSSWTVIDDVQKLPEKISRIYGGLTN
jgi:uncharacterized protein YegL